jgi:hypothetical protein
MNYTSDFDLDLKNGQGIEKHIEEILRGNNGLIEIKNDKISPTTENIAIEFECRGKPSGISITKANH